MKRLLLAASVTALCTLSASAQDAQTKGDPNQKQGTQGQKSSGQPKSSSGQPVQGQTKSAPSQPTASKAAPSQPAPSKTTQAPPPVRSNPPPQKTIIFQQMPSATYQRSHGYSERRHSFCQEKAWRLHQYESHAAADGYLSRRERATIRELKEELEDRCGGFRWRG